MVASEANVRGILERYESRAFTADYVERFPIWTRDLTSVDGSDTTLTGPGDQGRMFDFRVTVDIPSMQRVIFIPTLSEVLIEGCIIYLSIYLICYWIYASKDFGLCHCTLNSST